MGVSLNVGCGEKSLSSINNFKCINIDIRPLPGVDMVCDVRQLPFDDNYFDRILASDIIEHFPVMETHGLIEEWARVLKVDGRMKIRTPSLKWMTSTYTREQNAEFISWHLFGGQEYKENFHYVIFDQKWLSAICSKFNLKTIEYNEIYSNFEIVVLKEA